MGGTYVKIHNARGFRFHISKVFGVRLIFMAITSGGVKSTLLGIEGLLD